MFISSWKNLPFLCLRDLLKWKYPHGVYCMFLNNFVPSIWHLGVLAQNNHNLCTWDLVLILPQSIRLNLQVLVKYCIYLLLQGDITNTTLNFCKLLFPCIIAIFLNIIFLEINIFKNFFKSFNSSGIGCKLILLKTAWHGILFLERCLSYVLHI